MGQIDVQANITFSPRSVCLPKGSQLRVWPEYGQKGQDMDGNNIPMGPGISVQYTQSCLLANHFTYSFMGLAKNLKGARKAVKPVFRIQAEKLKK